MNFKELFADDDAVSPVIGVILMVAITVILAAVIGTFVLGLGEQVQTTAPQASFTFDFAEATADKPDVSTDLVNSTDGSGNNPAGDYGTLTITHDGGDSVPAVRLAVGDGSAQKPGTDLWSGEVSAGSSGAVDVDTDDTVRVTWTASDGSNSATLGRWTGPDA